MAKRGRKPLMIPTIDWKCQIPVDVATKVDLLLLDPLTNKPVYGSRSVLVTSLLRAWLSSRIKQPEAQLEGEVDNLEQSP